VRDIWLLPGVVELAIQGSPVQRAASMCLASVYD